MKEKEERFKKFRQKKKEFTEGFEIIRNMTVERHIFAEEWFHVWSYGEKDPVQAT